jgi:hypothetical protein
MNECQDLIPTRASLLSWVKRSDSSESWRGFLAVSSGKGWLDGWRMIAGDDT